MEHILHGTDITVTYDPKAWRTYYVASSGSEWVGKKDSPEEALAALARSSRFYQVVSVSRYESCVTDGPHGFYMKHYSATADEEDAAVVRNVKLIGVNYEMVSPQQREEFEAIGVLDMSTVNLHEMRAQLVDDDDDDYDDDE